MDIAPDLAARLARLPLIRIGHDLASLPESEHAVLPHLIAAARCMDEIFWRQIDEENPALLAELSGEARAYLIVNKGRWDAFQEHAPFIGNAPRPLGAAFYPADITREEFEAAAAANPALRDTFTVIRREDGGLRAIPYHEFYRPFLDDAAQHLRAAAAVTENRSLRTYLILRAEALLTDDFFASDMAWMDIEGDLDVVIGPYETYDDRLFSYKAAYETFITAVDPAASAALASYAAKLPALERALPIPDEHKNLQRGTDSPIRIVDLLFASGDGRGAIQTSAFNLPNDERVREAKGSKKVLLRNVMRAKYDVCGAPVAHGVLVEDQHALLSFDAFFTHVLFHELAHGLGPGMIEVEGERVEARILLKELYSPLEECKADVVGFWALLRALDEGWATGFSPEQLAVTDIGFHFRTIRMGVHEAHAGANAAQWAWYREQGAIVQEGTRFRVVHEKVRDAVTSLATELLMIEATGDYARAKTFFTRYGLATPEILAMVERVKDVPLDFRPVYTAAGE